MNLKAIQRALLLVAAVALWLPVALAHEGHQHHLMGTVTNVDQSKVELESTDGKSVTVALTKATKVLRGKAPASVADIKKGARIMVETEGTAEKLTATVVHLAAERK